MASTYSTSLKIELMATGENASTWGNITNTNLGTALEQAIVGLGAVSYASDANLTISISNSNAAQAARALVLNVTSAVSLTATRELVVPSEQKPYIVQNNTTGAQSITVKTSAGTGITVPNGRKAHLYVDGTNVIQMFDFVDINGGAIDGTAIGASSASTGSFTSLVATTADINGGTIDGTAIGASSASTGVFTTLTANTAAVDTNTTQVATTAYVVGQAASATPLVNGTAAVGTSLRYARGDHVHGTDTTRAPLASPTFTGTPAAPTAAADTNTTQVATTAYVVGQATSATPLVNGTAAVGTSLRYARGDHVHGTDTTRAPLASPTFTGTPAAPTAAADTNTTQVATTAYVVGQATSATPLVNGTAAVGTSLRYARGDHVHGTDTTRAPLASPTFTGTPAAPTAAVDTNTTQVATTAYVVGQGYLKSATASSTYLALTGGSLTGNLGLNVVLPAWGVSRTVVQAEAAVFAAVAGFSSQMELSANCYVNSSGQRTYFDSDFSTLYKQDSGSHKWYTAPSGTLNTAVSFTQTVDLDTSGNLTMLAGSFREKQTAVAASDINLSLGNYFSRTISGTTTFTVSNIPASGTAASFILDLTNGGSAAITWWANVKWAGGTAPTLTAAGRDVLGFFTYNNGTTWTGLVLGKDVK